MANTPGLSAPPPPIAPDVPISQAYGLNKGISATPGFHGVPPRRDSSVQALVNNLSTLHGMTER